ncbi:MAG: DNA double-strand break repair nuclease NurA [Thaumarchaeota archaeon]|nr:DNA double-strand break repair nuclease NurA [Nitrososphaerota archaeon]
MSNNPVRNLIGDLGKQLTEKNHSNELLSIGQMKTFPITTDKFKEIAENANPKKIAFIDGGDGSLEESPNFLITINRVYFSMFQGKKRVSPTKLKSRLEFFSSVVSNVSNEGGKKKISYETKLYPYDQNERKNLPDEQDLVSQTESTTILERSRLTSLARRFAEWKLATLVVKEELRQGDMIVIDGSLQTNFKNETKYARELYSEAMKKGVIVCGLTKTSRLITDSGDPLLARIQEISEGVSFGKWFVEVAETVSADDRGFMMGAKFHTNSRHVFRFEILREQFKKMSEQEKNNVLGSLAENSQDIAMLGYPYGSIDADRFAQVRKNELNMYRGLMIAEMSRLPEWKKLQRYTLTTKFHDELNGVTS